MSAWAKGTGGAVLKRWGAALAVVLFRPRWLIVLTGAVLAAAVGGYFFWGWREAEDLRRQALAALDDRDFERAKARLQAYLTARPGDGEGHFLLARACRRARGEDFDLARQNLEEARKSDFSRVDLALETAMLDAQQEGVTPDREAALRPSLESRTPGEGLVLEALARGSIGQNRLDEANGWLNQWVERAPDDWYPRLWRGALFEYLNQPNLAVADFEFVLAKRPADEEVRTRLGLMLVQSGYDYQTALKYLESDRRTRQGDADVLVGIARCERMLQRPEQAEALLRQILADHPDHVDALLALVSVEADRGDDAQALELLRRLEPLAGQSHGAATLARLRRLEPVPNNTDPPYRLQIVYNLYVTVLGRLGRADEAAHYRAEIERVSADVESLSKAMQEHQQRPHDVAVLDRVGGLYLRLGMPDEGTAALERALQEDPNDLPAHQALADYYERHDDPESRRRAEQHRRFAGPQGP